MAGIGFRLNKYFSKDLFFENLKGVLYSVFISSGPWLSTVLTIAVISHFAKKSLPTSDLYLFRTIICYTYASTLILFGLVEMPLTRYFADKIYVKDITFFKSVFFTVIAFYSVVGSVLGGIFLYFSPFSMMMKVTTLALFIFIFMIWVSMIFLSAAKNYVQIVFSYLGGGAIAIVLGPILGQKLGLAGHLLGLTIGQGLTAVFLAGQVLYEYQGPDFFSFEFINYFKRYWMLMFVGLFYYSGIWIDKIMFWFAPSGKRVLGPYYTSPYYDTAFFLAYLTVVPSLAIFLVNVETNFYKKYLDYFHQIEEGANLTTLDNKISDMIESLHDTFNNLFKFQLFFTLIAWYFSHEILKYFELPTIHLPLLRYGIIASFFQISFLVLNILLLYFKAYYQVLFNYSFFLVTNGILSYFTSRMDFRFHGLGITIAAFLTFIFSALWFNARIVKTNFFTFMGQSMSKNNYQES